jgi:hypothetical protein
MVCSSSVVRIIILSANAEKGNCLLLSTTKVGEKRYKRAVPRYLGTAQVNLGLLKQA